MDAAASCAPNPTLHATNAGPRTGSARTRQSGAPCAGAWSDSSEACGPDDRRRRDSAPDPGREKEGPGTSQAPCLPLRGLPLVGYGEPTLDGRFLHRRLRSVRVLEHHPEPLLGHREPRCDGPLGNPEGLRDGPVRVAVVVPENYRRRLLWRQLRERYRQVAVLDDLLRIRGEPRPADAANHLTDLAQPHLALVGDRGVDRDPVHPCFGRRDRLPGSPLFVSALECVLRAVLGGRSIAEHGGQRAEDLSVRRLVETFEICFVAGFVRVRRLACVSRRLRGRLGHSVQSPPVIRRDVTLTWPNCRPRGGYRSPY